jgi:ribosomal protein S12 methylthiotransferase
MKKGHIDIISLGCSKNLIDSERLMCRLEERGWTVTHDPETPSGEYVVVNTCGFIGDAKEESINMLLGLAELKASGNIGKLVAMGCLTERYRETLMQEIPEIDMLYGKFDWNKFIDELPNNSKKTISRDWDRTITTQSHSAYLKISEGCNRMCAFCAIPLITGRHKSRPEEEIVEEVKSLVARGVKEFNVIAQDLSSYGLDLYGEHRLAQLIDKLADIKGVEWIRLHYAYPTDFPHDILDVMARRENVCKYLDIALQHCSDNVLEAMRRHIDKARTIELLDEIRAKVPGIKIRTTLMVGFPGETEEDFEELLDFVKTQRFDRMGAFAYCEEDDTYAARNLVDNISDDVKQRRLDTLMETQQVIAEELANAEIGKRVRLLVDEVNDGVATCRSEWDSPEVDLTYTVNNCNANPGDFIDAEVTAAYTFDFEAKQL